MTVLTTASGVGLDLRASRLFSLGHISFRQELRTLQAAQRRTSDKRAGGHAAMASIQGIAARVVAPIPGALPGVAVNSLVYFLGYSVLLKGLTPAGILHSWVLGNSIYSAFGWRGYLLVCLYFLLGSAVTKVKIRQKEAEGIAEQRSGRRSIGSVWGSGLAGLICAVAALTTQHHQLWKVGFIASFVSKFSDTVSSEIGKAYGKTTYLSTNFRTVPRGTEGAVSLEGTLAGLAGAAAFTLIAVILNLVPRDQAWVIAVAAFLANYAESLLGAFLQGRDRFEWLSNDIVNILQTCLAAYLAMFLNDF